MPSERDKEKDRYVPELNMPNAEPLMAGGKYSLMMLVENGVMIDWARPITMRMITCCQKYSAKAVEANATENINVVSDNM